MLETPEKKNQGFLPIARKVLSDQSYAEICRWWDQRRLPNNAENIIERWALNCPNRLKMLEEKTPTRLLYRLREQADLENETLDRETALRLKAQFHWEDEDILRELGVETDLVVLTLRNEVTPGPLPPGSR